MALQIRTTGVEDYLDGGSANLKALIIGGPGAGKGFPPETPILTPNGWVAIGELAVGDEVIGSNGGATTVIGVYPRGEQPLYRLTFTDGASIVSDGDHLWPVRTRKQRDKNRPYYAVSTAELASTRLMYEMADRRPRPAYYVPLPGPIQHVKVQFGDDLPLHPYLLGVLLANGSLGHGNGSIGFTTNDQHIASRVMNENPEIVFSETTCATSTSRRWTVRGARDAVRRLGLYGLHSADKFIPAPYLVADEESRRELLAGLMDCDGSASGTARPRYHTTSHALADGVVALVRSLGGVATVSSAKRDVNELTVGVKLSNPFTLPRKADRHHWSGQAFRGIAAVEPAGHGVTICIAVDAVDSLFIADGYLVTHNTRTGSFWPKPIYADCENSRASIADRKVPYAEIRSSKEMLDFLAHLKALERRPRGERPYQTVVIDTLDGYQRKIKDEWIQANDAEVFKGYEAWGYLDSKISLLMTRLLNLDYNVLVLVHYKDKMIKDDEGKESRELMLQLQGDIKDTAFNDFDLVGWLGTYWAAGESGREEHRGITFDRTPEKPFLKDRFHVMPKWMTIDFTDDDYGKLYKAFLSRVDELSEGQHVEDVPEFTPGPRLHVLGPIDGGPVERTGPPSTERALTDMSKTELQKVAQDLGIAWKANTLKSELIKIIETTRATKSQATVEPPPPVVAPPEEVAVTPSPSPVVPDTGGVADQTAATSSVPSHMTTEAVAEALGGTVIEESTGPAVLEEPAPVVVPPLVETPLRVCADCGKDLADEDQDYVRLGWVKWRRYLCEEHFMAARKAKA